MNSTQAPGAPESPADVTTVAADAKAKRRFTDTLSFALRCLVCNAGLRGQQDAQDHAAATGHANFAQTGH